MSQTSVLKSVSVTNLDTIPVITNTSGEGGLGVVKSVNDWCTPLSADAIGSTYRLCRIPTVAKIKKVTIWSAIASAGAADIDIAFSDSTIDLTPVALQGGIVQITGPVDNKLFGAAQSLVALAAAGVDVTFAGSYTQAYKNTPLWNVLVGLGATQFTSDPGGYFDILLKVTTAVTTGGIVAAQVDYVM